MSESSRFIYLHLEITIEKRPRSGNCSELTSALHQSELQGSGRLLLLAGSQTSPRRYLVTNADDGLDEARVLAVGLHLVFYSVHKAIEQIQIVLTGSPDCVAEFGSGAYLPRTLVEQLHERELLHGEAALDLGAVHPHFPRLAIHKERVPAAFSDRGSKNSRAHELWSSEPDGYLVAANRDFVPFYQTMSIGNGSAIYEDSITAVQVTHQRSAIS